MVCNWWIFLFLGVLALTRGGRPSPSAEPSLSVPLSVSIWLLGANNAKQKSSESFPVSNDEDNVIEAEEFEETLRTILPYCRPRAPLSASPASDSDGSSSAFCDSKNRARTAASPGFSCAPADSGVQFALHYAVLGRPASDAAQGAKAGAGSGTGGPGGESSTKENELVTLERIFMRAYADLINKSPVNAAGQREVQVTAVAALLRDLADGTMFGSESARLPVEFVQPSLFNLPVLLLAADDPSSPLAPHILRGGGDSVSLGRTAGSGSGSGSVCASSVVGAIAFYDNTAAACDLLSQVTFSEAEGSSAGHGGESDAVLSLPLQSIHHIRGHFFSYAESDDMLQRELHRQIDMAPGIDRADKAVSAKRRTSSSSSSVLTVQAVRSLGTRLAAVVVSAVQAFSSAGRLPPASSAFVANKLLVPIIVLRGRGGGEAGTAPLPVDVHAVEAWLRPLLPPGQELAVVAHEHFLSEHPLVSVAIASAQESYSSNTSPVSVSAPAPVPVPYIRSRELVRALARAGDPLCAALLRRSGLAQGDDQSWLEGDLVDIDAAASFADDLQGAGEGEGEREGLEQGTGTGTGTAPRGGEDKGGDGLLLRWLSQKGRGEELEDHQAALGAVRSSLMWWSGGGGGSDDDMDGAAKDAGGGDSSSGSSGSSSSSGSTSRRRRRRSGAGAGVSVFPVFVLSDVLVHTGSRADGGNAGMRAGAEPAILPLLDKDLRTAVHGNTVLAVHSVGGPDVRVFNRATQRWQVVPSGGAFADVAAIVAAGLTEALTGVTAPYSQSARRGVVDFTWGAGVHPFGLGDFPAPTPLVASSTGAALGKQQQRVDYGGVYAWLGRRSQLASRAHLLLRRSAEHAARLLSDVRQVLQAVRMLHVHAAEEGTSPKSHSVLSSLLLWDAGADGIPPLSDNAVSAVLLAFRKQNARKSQSTQKDDRQSAGAGVGASAEQGQAAQTPSDAHLESILLELEVLQRSGALVQEAEQTLLALAAQGNAERRLAVLRTVREMRRGPAAGALAQPAAAAAPNTAAANNNNYNNHHRAVFASSHLQPYINLLEALDGLEAHLRAAGKSRRDLLGKLRLRLAACTVEFNFLDNSDYSHLDLGSRGMVADFAAVLERPERGKAAALSLPAGKRQEVSMWSLVWDYFRGGSGRDYAPDAAYRRQEGALAAKREQHLDAISQGLQYGAGTTAAAASDHEGHPAAHIGLIAAAESERAGSSKLFRWIGATFPTSRILAVIAFVVALIGVRFILRKLRARLEQRTKKMT